MMSKEKIFPYFTSSTYFVLVPHEVEIHKWKNICPKWNREYDSFIFLFFQMLFHGKTSQTLHTGLFSIIFLQTSILLYHCSTYEYISVHTRYILLWSSFMNYLPTKTTVETIFLRISSLECGPTKLPTSVTRMLPWTDLQTQSHLLWRLKLQNKASLSHPSPPFFQALFSHFFPPKGKETEGKTSCSSKSDNVPTFYLEQAPLGVKSALLSIGKCDSLLQEPESYPVS